MNTDIVNETPTPAQEQPRVVIRPYLIRPEASTVRFAQHGAGGMSHLTQDGAIWNKALCGKTALTGWHKAYGVTEVRAYHVCKACSKIAQARHGFTTQEVEELY